MLALLSRGVNIGFAAGITPGPLQTYLILQTLRCGWQRAAWIIPAPLIADGPIVAVILLVLGQASADLLRVIGLVGGAFVLYLAWGVWKQLHAGGFRLDDGSEALQAAETNGSVLRRAVALNVLSPGPWLFWSTVNGPLLVSAWRESPALAAAFLLGFYGTFLGTMAAQVALFHRARRLGPRVVTAALWIALVVLIVFALTLWANALGSTG